MSLDTEMGEMLVEAEAGGGDAPDLGDGELLQPWDRALVAFVTAGYGPGFVLTHEWMHEALESPAPTDGMTLEEIDAARFMYLGRVKRFGDLLLKRERYWIDNVRGVGYLVVQPAEQADLALTKCVDAIREEVSRLGMRMRYVRTEALDADQKRRHDDTKTRGEFVRTLLGKAMRRVVRWGGE